jgi:protein arginine kinase activator
VKCDRCDNEATVHEVRIEAGKRREKHLCEQCARAEGVAPPQIPAPITQLLSNFMLQQGEAAQPVAGAPAAVGAGAAAVCPSCSTTYAQFRQSGLLGCPTCYAQFENQLGPLLARAHEGGTHHVGKAPRAVAGGSDESGGGVGVASAAPTPAGVPAAPKPDPRQVARAIAERIAILKKRLAEAVAAEKYETAAKLRDELVRLEGPPTAGPAPAPKRKPRSAGDRPAGSSGEGAA